MIKTAAENLGSRDTAEIESRAKGYFYLAAGLSFVLSVYLFFTGDKETGIFVGIWVPSILSAGTLVLTGGKK